MIKIFRAKQFWIIRKFCLMWLCNFFSNIGHSVFQMWVMLISLHCLFVLSLTAKSDEVPDGICALSGLGFT